MAWTILTVGFCSVEAVIMNETELCLYTIAISVLIFISLHILGVPLIPYHRWGTTITKSSHFTQKKSVTGSQEFENLSLIWKKKMVDKADKDCSATKEAKFVCGECSDTATIGYALDKGFSVNVVCGPKANDENAREKLAELKDKYKKILHIYILPVRPERHAVLISDRYFLLEDKHEPQIKYKSAIKIENVNKIVKSRFMTEFERLQSNIREATSADIRSMGLYSDSISKGKISNYNELMS